MFELGQAFDYENEFWYIICFKFRYGSFYLI